MDKGLRKALRKKHEASRTVLNAAGPHGWCQGTNRPRSTPKPMPTRLPEYEIKEVIRGIPAEDTDDIITTSLVHPGNPRIVQAKRMGHFNSVIILFPVRYGSVETRCFLYKKKREYRENCGNLGHRADVCPRTGPTRCRTCGTRNPIKIEGTIQVMEQNSTSCCQTQQVEIKIKGQEQRRLERDKTSIKLAELKAMVEKLQDTVAQLVLQTSQSEKQRKEAEVRYNAVQQQPDLQRNEAGPTPTRRPVRRNMTPLTSTPSGSTTKDEGVAMQLDTTNQDIGTRIYQLEGEMRERGNLHQYLLFLPPERRPDVLAIQETWKAITIPGYQAFNRTNSSGVVRVTMLVRRNLPAQLHPTGVENIEHISIEILAGKKSHRNTFIANICSPPKTRHSFHQLLRGSIDMAKGKALLIVGYFNTPHMSWGYPQDSAKGRQLWQDIATLGLDLLTDPTQTTRKATGGCKDISPDLTLGHGLDAEWHNTLKTLDSDRCILNILLKRGPTKPKGTALRLVKWDTFRQKLDKVDRDEEIKDLDQWNAGIREVDASSTRNIPEEASLTAADTPTMEYTGQPHPTVDVEFRPFELMAANRELKTRSAPGPDEDSNKLLRHLDEREIDRLTSYFNVCRRKGKIPEACKTAKM
ncbi:hypothetical protein HPB47_015812, partial [Ixodes persulcatus]